MVGQEGASCGLSLVPPVSIKGWQVATSLPRAKGTALYGFGNYTAPNYDALIDHPVMMGALAIASFTAHGAEHDIAIAGRVPGLDMVRLVRDTQAICEQQLGLFEPETKAAPFLDSAARYTFMTLAVGAGYGGLEHRASTALIANRSDFPCVGDTGLSAGYQQYLGLVSHEYFHTWNVKRIKPAAFAPYDLSAEAYTPLLWLFEGFTAYYDDLTLVRAGLTTPQAYMDTLAATISGVARGAGRLRQSAASASFNAWVKYYRQDENSPNVLCNYYTQGSLIALNLDLTIRLKTAHACGLDDVMRLLWQRFGRDFYTSSFKGVTLDDVYAAFKDATSLNLKSHIIKLTESAADVPLSALFKRMGIVQVLNPTSPLPSLGIRHTSVGNEVQIATAYTGEAAHRASLSGGDVLVAIDGLRVTPASLPVILGRYAAGAELDVLAWRRDELHAVRLTLDAAPKTQVSLSLNAEAAKSHAIMSWLQA